MSPAPTLAYLLGRQSSTSPSRFKRRPFDPILRANAEALTRAAKGEGHTEMIVVTAYGRPKLSVDRVQLGAFDYLDRETLNTDFRPMLLSKILSALNFGAAKLALSRS